MVQLSHVAIAFVMMILVGGGAFFGGLKWKEAGSGETAAAASVLDDFESDSGEEYIDEETPAPADAPLYKVLRVVDGDTIVIEVEGKSESVRMIGVDTPELNDSRTGVQCFAKEAAEKAKSLVTGKSIRLEKDPSQGERDKYKRLLGYVFLENGAFVNMALIAEGYAHEYTYDGAYKYQKQFKAAQAEAKEAGSGLWAEENCPTTPPVRSSKSAPKTTSNTNQAAAAQPVQQPVVQPVVQPTVQPTTAPEPKPEAKEEPKPEPDPTPEPSPSNLEPSSIVCSTNTYNCPHFKTQKEAQDVFEQCGGVSNDIHRLDQNKDGRVCESLP
jgi:endonuclease YncB( thermonuclease family)